MIRQKEQHERSERYRDFVDHLPCCICGHDVGVTHHHHGPKGLGETLGDLHCVPLCRSNPKFHYEGCHERYHDDKLTADQVAELEIYKLITLRDYVCIEHEETAEDAPLHDHALLRAWLIENHPEDFEESSVTRKRSVPYSWPKRKVQNGQKLAGRKLKGRGFPKPTGPKRKIGERRPGSVASRSPKKGMA